MKEQIKNIIFDFGGVLFDIDHGKTKAAFEKLGVKDFQDLYGHYFQQSLFDSMEKGSISNDDFLSELKKHCRKDVTTQEVREAWNALLLDIPGDKIRLLQELGSRYRLFLLSNTNAIHVNQFSEIIDRGFGMQKFTSLFEKVYYSHLTGMRKPSAEIFEKVIHENNLLPAETLFLDDSTQHIEGARSVGLRAEWVDVNASLRELLERALD